MNTKAHWELVYQTKNLDQMSWLEQEPTLSMDFIRHATSDPAARIIEVGGGPSSLVNALLRDGYSEVTVEADVLTTAIPADAFDVWHDRAVFHFLTSAADRSAYITQLRRALRSGGHAVIATFAEDGADTFSGFEVARYTPEGLQRELGEAFDLVESAREEHVTPAGSRQSFVYCLFRYSRIG